MIASRRGLAREQSVGSGEAVSGSHSRSCSASWLYNTCTGGRVNQACASAMARIDGGGDGDGVCDGTAMMMAGTGKASGLMKEW